MKAHLNIGPDQLAIIPIKFDPEPLALGLLKYSATVKFAMKVF